MDLSPPAHDLLGSARAHALERLALVGVGLTGRRIAELSGIPPSTAQRALAELEKIGLVESLSAGRARLYTLNRSHVL